MSRKIVIEEKGENVIVGIQKIGQDPYVIASKGTIESVLPVIPALMAQATLVRAEQPRQPVLKSATPAPAPKAKTRKPEKKEEPAKEQPKAAEAEAKEEEPKAETGEEAEVTPEAEPEAEQLPESLGDNGEIAVENKPEEPQQAAMDLPKPEEPETEAEKPVDLVEKATEPEKRRRKSGGEQFYIKATGAGPFADIQAVFDAMGMDKEKRPHHNRYDRLSGDLREKIEQRSSSNG